MKPCRLGSARRVACLVACAGGLVVGIGAGSRPVRGQDADLYDPETVRGYDFTFDAPDWESALRGAGDVGNARARLVVDGEGAEDVGVRYKGLSSMLVQSRKKPLNVTIDAFVPGQRMRGYDVINLNNGYSDPSFVREALMTEMLRPFMPTQETAFARVRVNGEVLGAYLAAEQVEGTFLSRWFPDTDGILVKCDPPAGPGVGARTFHSALEWEGEDLAAYRPLYEVKTDGAEAAGLAAIREAARILDAPVSEGGVTDADLPARLVRVLDVDRALWYLAANNLFVNYDSYYFGHNYFVYRSEADGLLHLLLWDTSLSFGGLELGSWGGAGSGTRVDPFALEGADDRPVLRRLLAVPEWRADFAAHYRALMADAFDPAALERRGAEMQSLVRPVLEADPNRLFPLDLFQRNLREEVTSWRNMGPGGRSPGVIGFAREREAWLRARPELSEPDHALVAHVREPEEPEPGQEARMTVRFGGEDAPSSVRLVFRIDGGRPSSIELAPHGGSWLATIPGQTASAEVTYYVRAELPQGRSAFHPAANLTQPWRYRVQGPDLPSVPGGPLVINEILADNETVLADEAGEYDDWLELHNRGDAPVSLGGWFLGQSAEAPWRFALPDVVLPPGAHALVWCDGDPDQGPDHAPFKLSRGGEEVRLSTRDATVDVVAFGMQGADVSYARVPDGAEAWWACRSPSPGMPNACPDIPSPTSAPPSTTPSYPAATPSARTPTRPAVLPTPGSNLLFAVWLPVAMVERSLHGGYTWLIPGSTVNVGAASPAIPPGHTQRLGG